MKLTNSPILRFYHMEVEANKVDQFEKVGKENMTTSVETEPGTLFMASTHEEDKITSNYVLECYRDEGSYETHKASPQFTNFINATNKIVTIKETFELMPKLILTKDDPVEITAKSDYYIRLIKLTLVDEYLKQFGEDLRQEMTHSLGDEKGFKAVLAGNFFDVENEWRIFEIYENKDAYKQHIVSDRYKNLEKKVHDMIYSTEQINLDADIIVDQGKLEY